MDIEKLLTKSSPPIPTKPRSQQPQRPLTLTSEQNLIHEERLMKVWEQQLYKGGFMLKSTCERNTLTDCFITRNKKHSHHTTTPPPPLSPLSSKIKPAVGETPIHVKIIGRHMNGSFRCHIGTGKQSRPIQTTELSQQMRMMVVFFRVENSKSPWVMTDFLFFPTWLLHLFRYAHHDSTPGRTDVRFLENAALAKEDHIYRLNHVLNSLFRFQLYCLDYDQLDASVRLANYLFDTAGLNPMTLPRPHLIIHDRDDNDAGDDGDQCTTTSSCDRKAMTSPKKHQQNHHQTQPSLYASLILLLHAPRPTKIKTMCTNCNTKPSSRRQLCVACYRYQLKHNEPRPLRLIVANRPGPRSLSPPMNNPTSPISPPPSYSYSSSRHSTGMSSSSSSVNAPSLSPTSPTSPTSSSSIFGNHQRRQSSGSGKKKASNKCVNCGVTETHQWYRNLCGQGHWCETCKSYYLRHGKIRPSELFVKAAKRKVDVRSWMDWTSWCLDDATVATATMAINKESQQRRWSSLVTATGSSQLLSPPQPSSTSTSTSSTSSSSTTTTSSTSPKKSGASAATTTNYSGYGLTPFRHSYIPTTSARPSSYFTPTPPVQLPPPPATTLSSRYSMSGRRSSSKSYSRYSMPLFESPTASLLSESTPVENSIYIKKECRQPSFTYTKPCRSTSSYIMNHQDSP
ncbi:hypothetical protein BCR42DRAFT_467096 [Absidia repens]|uniref:GATA-type domain-containing protein n=1 Tax=Absidia repens TaxID=90262 RepID=A0A1X2ICY1_9FUNG|nr:hypothetical protein BCR42DRAFT_467096 [Absidia repens]